jgi:MFS family permease
MRRRATTDIVATWLVILSFNSGFGFYALSVYTRDLAARSGLSLSAASIGATIYLIALGGGGIAVVAAIARLGDRLVVAAGVVVSAVCLPLLGVGKNAWQIWIVYAMFGLAASAFSQVPASASIVDRVGKAATRPLAIALIGLSAGGALLVPPLGWAISAHGLFWAGVAMSCVMLAVCLPLIVMRLGPVEPVDFPPSDVDPASPSTPAHREADLADRSRTRFRAICFAFSVLYFSSIGATTLLLTLAHARHIPDADGALVVIAISAVVGRLLAIPMLAHWGLRGPSLLLATLGIAAATTLAMASSTVVLYAGSALLGLTSGNYTVLLPLNVLHACGRRGYAKRFARATFVVTASAAAAPALIGGLAGTFHGYGPPMLLVAFFTAVATIVLAVSTTARTRGMGHQGT